jgi:hypothetical protein
MVLLKRPASVYACPPMDSRSRLLLLLAPSLVPVAISGCSEVIWSGDLAGAQRQAAKDGRLVLVYYGSPLNPDCARMERTVFSVPEVIDAMAGTIPVRLDPLWHRRWARRLGIGRIPSFVIHGPDGQVINIRQGAMNEAQFRAFVIGGKLNR